MAVAQCESGQQQFDSKGNVLTNATHDFGYFQINRVHIQEAKALGFDIMTEKGNVGYALYLYNQQGLTPWNASKPCWSKSLAENDS